eukprot:GHVL01020606.1.p1 GENE.GHVL01020606.1~~GHVL01020606.1.p1  ORF type:complete len:429 (-),score=92.10 GHVL01020606.1:532-1818(-)
MLSASLRASGKSPLRYIIFKDSFNKNNRCYSSIDIPFEGVTSKEFVSNVSFQKSTTPIPVLRQLDYSGKLIDGIELPFSKEKALEMYGTIVRMANVDSILYSIQRQGRISFYMTNYGEEAAQVGSSAAWSNNDILFPQYRELGALMHRGLSVQNIVDQCFGNTDGHGKGRQMPVHYGSRELNIQTISSPLATQIPQACGAGYAFARDDIDKVAIVYFGEGAASEGDFATAINFSATLGGQTIFVCRNNGYAISTPVSEQYAGDGIAARSIAYGLNTIRVDGNDIVAVYNAATEARRLTLSDKSPVLLELMTYRVGHHSTSDDASRYRADDEVQSWQDEGMSGSGRFRLLLTNLGWFDESHWNSFNDTCRNEVLSAVRTSEKKKLWPIDEMFNDVYESMTPNLQKQKDDLFDHISRHEDHYEVSKYEKK